MNLRSHLDRFCGLRPMDPDRHPRQPSRSPQRVHAPPGFRFSPFFAPPGWQPPPPRPDRAVILQIDLRPMKQLALLDNYYDILAPQVYTHLTNDDYRSAFTLYKIIYPNYVSRHYVQELYELVVDTFLKRWSLHVQVSQLILTIATTQGKHDNANTNSTTCKPASSMFCNTHILAGKHTNHFYYNKLRKVLLLPTYLMDILTPRPSS